MRVVEICASFEKMANEYAFYRLATIGWANPLLRTAAPLLDGRAQEGVVLDLSKLEFTDSFGITFLAACFHVVVSGGVHGSVRRPKRDDVHKYLLDVGLYEAIGIGDRFGPRQASRDRVDLVHITALQPGFIDYLLDFLGQMQPFEEGLRPSMRMALLELIQNFAEHSGSEAGAWVAGQGHPQTKRITLCIVDLGRGIPGSLRTARKYRRHTDGRLIELSTEEGISSVPTSSRGLGLATIRRFVRANGGTLTILAGKGRVTFPPDRRPISKAMDVSFPGTAAFLSLVPTRGGLFQL